MESNIVHQIFLYPSKYSEQIIDINNNKTNESLLRIRFDFDFIKQISHDLSLHGYIEKQSCLNKYYIYEIIDSFSFYCTERDMTEELFNMYHVITGDIRNKPAICILTNFLWDYQCDILNKYFPSYIKYKQDQLKKSFQRI